MSWCSTRLRQLACSYPTKLNIGFIIVFNIGLNMELNIWFNTGFNIGVQYWVHNWVQCSVHYWVQYLVEYWVAYWVEYWVEYWTSAAIYGPPTGHFGFFMRCGIAGSERVPPSPLGWYYIISYQLVGFYILLTALMLNKLCLFQCMEIFFYQDV